VISISRKSAHGSQVVTYTHRGEGILTGTLHRWAL